MGRYSKNSEYAHKMERIRRDHGAFKKAGVAWTNEEDDLLLEGFLVHDWAYLSQRDCFAHRLLRTEHAIKTRLWKLVSAYTDASHYQPNNRTDRRSQEHAKITVRDKALLEILLKHHVENGLPLSHFECILCRSEEQIKGFCIATACAAKPMKYGQNLGKFIPGWKDYAQDTYEALQGTYLRVMRNL